MDKQIKQKAEELIALLEAQQNILAAANKANPTKRPKQRYASAIFISHYDEDKKMLTGICCSTGFSNDIARTIDKGTEKNNELRAIIYEAVCPSLCDDNFFGELFKALGNKG